MNIAQVENNVKSLIDKLVAGNVPTEDFIYELLLAYGHRASTVAMLRKGHYNIAKDPDEIIFKRHLYFKQVQGDALHAEIDRMKNQKLVVTNRTRFVICTNFDQLLAVDTKTCDSLDIALAELPRKFDFFLPWAGMEKAVYQGENPADVKAAEKMAKLFDLIKADNFTEESADDKAALHNLNVFLTRLLFCFFAEDTEIFDDNQFSNAVQGHTSEDGSDLAEYLNRLFAVLNTPEKKRGALPDYLSNFPYVNGGLFADDIPSPAFSRKSRRMLIECCSELNWSDINPDIFGSMIQAVAHPDQRGGMGMHYTSVTNIMKAIEPLFLNDLYDELDKVSNNATKLQKLQQRLGKIKIFDPACGSGNFLIIAYKELRRLEMELLKRWKELELEKTGQVLQAFSVIKLSQFYGIELDDFAHEVALLSLWLAEHQINLEFRTEFGESIPSLPLKQAGNVIYGNANRTNWSDVCDNFNSEVYIIGNPPYKGESSQSKEQKRDMDIVFAGMDNYKKQDYISCWFFKAANYIKGKKSKFAFVTTSSTCQGSQVAMLWPHIFNCGLKIQFCHKPFQWKNNARDKAGVHCTVIGIGNVNGQQKYIYDEFHKTKATNISPYLIQGSDICIKKVSSPLFDLPAAMKGNGVYDEGNLMLTRSEKDSLILEYPQSKAFIKRVVGSDEFIKNKERWCIWIRKDDVNEALAIPPINNRVKKVEEWRKRSGLTAQAYASTPYRFKGINVPQKNLLLIPAVSAHCRAYVPMGFLSKDIIVTDLAFMILDPEPYLLSLLSSAVHQVWIETVTGRHGNSYRYSLGVCYNSFPAPSLTPAQKELLSKSTMDILTEREKFSNLSLAQMYDEETIPESLRAAHKRNDEIVDVIYSGRSLTSTERLEILMAMYTNKVTGEQNA